MRDPYVTTNPNIAGTLVETDARHFARVIAQSVNSGIASRLMRAGAEIYEYQPSMYHVKMIIVDDQ